MVKKKFSFDCMRIGIKNALHSFNHLFVFFNIILVTYAYHSRSFAFIVVAFIPLMSYGALTLLFIPMGFLVKRSLFCHHKHFIRSNTLGEIYASVLISVTGVRYLTVFVPLYWLKKSFQNRNLNYEILMKATEYDLDERILDNNIQELYLVGHGHKGSFSASDRKVPYSKYQHVPNKKQIVSQLHCNHLVCDKNKNQSLTEMIANDSTNSFLSNGYCTYVDFTYYCIKQWYKSR